LPPKRGSQKRSAQERPKSSVPPLKKAASAKRANTPEKLPYEKSEEEVIAASKAEVQQFFHKLEERKKWINPEKPYFYVKPEKLRKKVADQKKK